MSSLPRAASVFADSKPHYALLDGLRGVAALIVIVYHVFECFSWSPAPHGYLAVDFFFVLSGFVIGYAYDDRWGRSLTTRSFFRRRLIRLHPMVVLGALIGAVCFVLQGSVKWDGQHVATSFVLFALLMNMLMLPLPVGARADVRGNGELFPLNGPNWSLFFEYVGNILYALLLRRLPTLGLALVCIASGAGLTWIAVSDGCLGVGWSMIDGGLWSGFVRMLFPYSAGMLLARLLTLRRHSKAASSASSAWFIGASAALLLVAIAPLCFGELPAWAKGLYDACCAVFLFPAIVWLVAVKTSSSESPIVRFLGDVSYPLYAVHYPLMYLFYAHIGFSGGPVPIETLFSVWPVALALPFACLLLGWLSLRCYDIPVRRWLARHA
ncbi:MAG: acyltransferase [Alloprevotella sp.]|nr:acyltransferase [Alloprevotella sp.]